MSTLKVNVNQGTSFEINQSKEGQFVSNGETKDLDIKVLDSRNFHIIHKHQSFSAEVIKADYSNKSFEIRINNNTYQLEVEDRFDLLLHQLGMDNLASNVVTELKAPMPGLVLSTAVEVGQEVAKDEPLIVLEAMKMENVLKSPEDVKIKSIAVSEGEAVEKNQVLIEFE
tara:strand:- start:6146 stop:6655 length:510 start_codon:yes stop_codon:yes gene_type:complete